MPLLDKIVYSLTGSAMKWLGKRAYLRGDTKMYFAMLSALREGHVEGRLRSNREQ